MYTAHIIANQRPEVLDRIVAPFRKRGILPHSLQFEQQPDQTCQATIVFDPGVNDLNRIEKNLLRIEDVQSVEITG